MSEETISCPGCGVDDQWSTMERLVGNAAATITVDGDDLDIGHHGETDVNWDSSETFGIQCTACGWFTEGETKAEWMEALTPKPDIAAMLATRDRMKNR